MKYKLGIDLGSTSLGWAVVKLDKDNNVTNLVDVGVRIFPDGRDAKSHTPINVERRFARGMRRRNERIKSRKKRTLALIHKYGLAFDISKDIEHLENPYLLRQRAVEGDKLSPNELGRVFFHLAQRRGFKSNRKEERGETGGKLKKATAALREQIGVDKTLGQFQAENKIYRFAGQFDGVIIKDGALYPTRDMYLEEFHKICDVQNVSDEIRNAFEDAIFYQRRLKAPQIGRCIFEPDEYRAYKYTPEFQKFRALQQLNQLRIENHGMQVALTEDQRAKLCDILLNPSSDSGVRRQKNGHVKLTFAEIKKQLGLGRLTKFNLESEKRKEIDVDTTFFAFAEIGESDFWQSLSDVARRDILAKINNDNIDDETLIGDLMTLYGLSYARAKTIIAIPLEDDVGNVSVKAMEKLLPYLEQGKMFHDAVVAAGYEYADKDIAALDNLPYYGDLMVLHPSLSEDKDGKYRVMNATVHVAMNQIRVVVNELIGRYGKPFAINIEMGRDVSAGAEKRSAIELQQSKNKKENDRIAAELREIGIDSSRENIQKFKLWEMLGADRRCVYTGETISKEKLFGPQFEVEHILPFSRTLDDSLANKTISRVDANRFKGNRTPDEAFTDSDSKWRYEDVWARAQKLPPETRWRFNCGAMDLFLKNSDCIARALNDTRHITRLAVTYLQHVCENKYNVTGVSGKMTALFRDAWHLNWWKDKKDADTYRGNHIHHAIDAFVVACICNDSFYKLVKNTAVPELYFGKPLKEKHRHWFTDMSLPYNGFNNNDLKTKCEHAIISYRQIAKDPRASGTIGCLHEETAYNLEDFDKNGKAIMSRREKLPTTTKEREAFSKDFGRINETLKQRFRGETGPVAGTGDTASRFLDWAQACGIKKVRMLKTDVDITSWVPVFRTKADRDAFNDAFVAWYVADKISDGIRSKLEKKVQQEKEQRLRQQYQNVARKAYKWYIGGNNFCADVFEIRADDKRYPKMAGKWQIEIMSNYQAQLNSGNPMWRRKYATARRVMRLRINDMVIAEFSKNDADLPKGIVAAVQHQCALEGKETVQLVFRVKKISSNGKIYLRPHYIAREDGDTKSWAASKSSLQNHKARKIFVSPTGQILK